MRMAAVLRVDNLRKSYGSVAAVRGVSFAIEAKEIFGLLGPNGAGKTSTIECIMGLRAADGGSVEICGMDASKNPRQVKQRIGVQLQATNLQDKITPLEALKLFASFYRDPADAKELLAQFSLQEKANAKYETLSGGQRQRLALALAMINRPQVLLLDEPTAGLDPQSRRELQSIIRRLREGGCSILLCTHYIDEAQQLCDRVGIIDHGELVAMGTPAELIARSKSLPKIIARTSRPAQLEQLQRLESVRTLEVEDGAIALGTASVSATLAALMRLLQAEQIELLDVNIVRPSLEDVFIELTGRELRE